jgi:hypothetical protein
VGFFLVKSGPSKVHALPLGVAGSFSLLLSDPVTFLPEGFSLPSGRLCPLRSFHVINALNYEESGK